MKKYKKLYDDSYFDDRKGFDKKRQLSFKLEKVFINKYINKGKILDIGCSTGEFIDSLCWDGDTFGTDISEFAIKEAKKKGISFKYNQTNTVEFFDLVVLRGVIQHLDTPFLTLNQIYDCLKPGGYIIFLATPNTNSIYYKIWKTLPALDSPRNFYIPSDIDLINVLTNIGFEFKDIRYPYLEGPYSNVLLDHFKFLLKFFGFKVSFAFWHNMMELIFRKPLIKKMF
jgi:SAM-dependent methyltransferase